MYRLLISVIVLLSYSGIAAGQSASDSMHIASCRALIASAHSTHRSSFILGTGLIASPEATIETTFTEYELGDRVTYKKAKKLWKKAKRESLQISKGNIERIDVFCELYSGSLDYISARAKYRMLQKINRMISKRIDEDPEFPITKQHADFWLEAYKYFQIRILMTDILLKAKAIYEKEGLFDDDNYHQILSLLCEAYFQFHAYQDVLLLKHIDFSERALARLFLGDYNEAEQLIREMKQTKGSSYGILGEYYSQIGNYDEAIAIFKHQLETREDDIFTFGLDEKSARIYEMEGEYEKALKEYRKHLKRTRMFGYIPPRITMMERYLWLLASVKPNRVTRLKLNPLARFYKEGSGTDYMGYAIYLNLLGEYYQRVGKSKKALSTFQEGLQIVNDTTTKQYSTVYRSLSQNIAKQMEKRGEPEKALPYLQGTFESAKRTILNGLHFMPIADRSRFMETRESALNSIKSMTYRNSKIPAMVELSYNTELFYKNLLQISTIQIRKAISQSKDSALVNRFIQLQDTLTKEQEAEIIRQSNYQELFRDEYNLQWEDVRAKLRPDEAAIEFAFIKTKSGQEQYYALLLRPEYSSPRLIPCGTGKKIENALAQYLYPSLYSIIWKPLESELAGVKDVYLALGGLLHHVPFSALQDEQGEFLMNKYNLHHILSTREIVLHQKPEIESADKPSAGVFGGMRFNTSFKEKVATPDTVSNKRSIMRSLVDNLDTDRGNGFGDLVFSRIEADSIGKLLSTHGWDATVYVEEQATEANFKQLSSRSPSVLHVSTHGFYFRLEPDNPNIYKKLEDPLMRSGLVFSGVNDCWVSDEWPDDLSNDGVLTASEISQMDLSNTQLVVLSACNTAKGDIKNNEGTYGLQRAFRLAGVQSMIVTLWGVNDKTAQEFMTTFYAKWLGGAVPLREAFRLTQKEFQLKYENKVEEWAGFMLIE